MRELHGDWRDLFLGFRMALDLRKMILGCAFLVIATLIAFAFVRSADVRQVSLPWAAVETPIAGLGSQDFTTSRALADPLGRHSGAVNCPVLEAVLCRPLRYGPSYCLEWLVPEGRRRGNPFIVVGASVLGTWLSVPKAIEELSLKRAGLARAADTGSAPPEGAPARVAPNTAYAAWYAFYGVGFGLIIWALLAFFGGAMTRVAAVELARRERIELVSAARYAAAHYPSYLWAPLSVLIAVFVFGLGNYVIGLFGRHLLLALLVAVGLAAAAVGFKLVQGRSRSTLAGIGVFVVVAAAFAVACYFLWKVEPWETAGAIVAALLYPLALFSGFLIVLLVLGVVLTVRLMVPAVSAEGTDSFDAVSRAFSYLFLRPWRYLFYHLVACVYGLASVAFVFAFTSALARVAERTVFAGLSGGAADDLGQLLVFASGAWTGAGIGAGLKVAAVLMLVPLALVGGLMFGYFLSFAAGADTIIYFLLRKSVDDTPMEDVYLPERESAGPSPS